MTESVGFLELGKSYAQSANFLFDASRTGKVKLARRQPVDFLYAHAFELTLKACLLEHDSNLDVESYGHDLLRLYEAVRSQDLLNSLLHRVERTVKERWKSRLRGARDEYEKLLGFGQLTADESNEFGIYGNDVIGDELPELRKQIVWLGSRHMTNGGEFRYLRKGLDSRHFIKAFGLSDDVVWQSCEWALQELYDQFRAYKSACQS